MSRTAPARTATRRRPGPAALGLAVVIAAIVVALLYPSSPSPALRSGEAGPGATPPGEPRRAAGPADGAATEDDGVLPDGVTVYDDGFPGIAHLDRDLRRALRAAAADAADDGIVFSVNSGWRTPAYQRQLLREAVAQYGSESAAARWVATPDTSPHVSGDAVDIGPYAATTWLAAHGAAYGLCRIYDNEPWHVELRPRAVDRGCPPPYANPTHDPRMQR